jgi:hypothetical protein
MTLVVAVRSSSRFVMDFVQLKKYLVGDVVNNCSWGGGLRGETESL